MLLSKYDTKYPIATSLIKYRLNLIEKKEIKKFNISKDTIIIFNDSFLKSLLELDLGDYYLYNYHKKDSLAFYHYSQALNLSSKEKNKVLLCETLKKILFYHSKFTRNAEEQEKYLIRYKKNLYNDFEKANYYLENLKLKVAKNDTTLKSTNLYFSEGRKLVPKYEEILLANYYFLEGMVCARFQQKYEQAEKHFKKALSIFIKYQNIQEIKERIFDTYMSIGATLYSKKKYKVAIHYLKKADSIYIRKHKKRDQLSLYNWFSKSYLEIENYKLAYAYKDSAFILKDIISQEDQNIAIKNLEEKYKNDIAIAENTQLKKENNNLIIGTILFIIFGSTIATLSLKNSKRKQKLAEQQKELETQKNLTLLKEQEITTINAMVDGQEKERKRIAEDLHDNLGSVLATLKLHFENLKLNKEKKKINQENLFNKTENLIDEAYLKVRSIAHAKNAGVIANQGLLVAIKMMAEKISSAEKIKIEVIDFGLDKRLENSLEITIFRIVQELITNILKHAEAKNATINISLYDNNVNIIIEDDGKGFTLKNVILKDGMGLNSIKTRIAHLNGTFEVDSTIKKGTSILINIPIPF